MAETIGSKNIRLKYTNSNETTHSLLMFLITEFGASAIRGIICGEKIGIQREIHAVVFLKNKSGKRLKQLFLNNSSCVYSSADLINDFKDVFHMRNKVFDGDDFELNIWYSGLTYKQDVEILKQKDEKIKELEKNIKELKPNSFNFIGRGDEKSITVNINNNNKIDDLKNNQLEEQIKYLRNLIDQKNEEIMKLENNLNNVRKYDKRGKPRRYNKLSKIFKPDPENNYFINVYISSRSSSSIKSTSPTPSIIEEEKLRYENRAKERRIIKKYPTKHDNYNVDQKEITEEMCAILRRIEEKRTKIANKNRPNIRKIITPSNSSSERSDELSLKWQKKK